jgi:hypothetical protein
MFGRSRGLALPAEGRFRPSDPTIAVSVLRCRPEEVAAVIGSTRAGRTAAGGADATRESGRTAAGRVRLAVKVPAGALAASRRDHAPAA